MTILTVLGKQINVNGFTLWWKQFDQLQRYWKNSIWGLFLAFPFYCDFISEKLNVHWTSIALIRVYGPSLVGITLVSLARVAGFFRGYSISGAGCRLPFDTQNSRHEANKGSISFSFKNSRCETFDFILSCINLLRCKAIFSKEIQSLKKELALNNLNCMWKILNEFFFLSFCLTGLLKLG